MVALVSEYTGIISMFFADRNWSVQRSYGLLPEMFPFVVIGYSISKFNIIQMLKKTRKISSIFLLAGLFVVVCCKNKFPASYGIWYSGIYLILVGTIVVILFCIVPEKFWNNGKSVIQFLGKYTMGVYFMHPLIAFFVNMIANKMGFQVSTFGICFVVYFLSILISAIIDRLPFRFCKGLV